MHQLHQQGGSITAPGTAQPGGLITIEGPANGTITIYPGGGKPGEDHEFDAKGKLIYEIPKGAIEVTISYGPLPRPEQHVITVTSGSPGGRAR